MLEEFGDKKRTRKFWTTIRSKKAKREAFKSGSTSLEWRMVRKNKIYKIRESGRENCWARIFFSFGKYNMQLPQSKQEESTEEEEMKQQKQQRRIVIMKDLTKKIRSKRRMDAKICTRIKWICLLLRSVLQDALSEVTNIYPPLKLRVSVDDITAFLMREKHRSC